MRKLVFLTILISLFFTNSFAYQFTLNSKDKNWQTNYIMNVLSPEEKNYYKYYWKDLKYDSLKDAQTKDNFDHIKAYWPMIGRNVAQLALSCSVNDIDGTRDDTTKIYSMAGSEEQNPSMSTHDLVTLIKRVGKVPIERDTLYNVINDFTDFQNEEDKQFKGYLSLPVLN